VIEFELSQRKYTLVEPKGEQALVAYQEAMSLLETTGAGDAIRSASAINDAMQKAARLLSTSPRARPAVEALLKGGTIDGIAVDAKRWVELYAVPNRFSEPYLMALVFWIRLGFLSDGVEKQSDAE